MNMKYNYAGLLFLLGNMKWNMQPNFTPSTEQIVNAQVVHDGSVKRVIVTTVSGKHFGVEF